MTKYFQFLFFLLFCFLYYSTSCQAIQSPCPHDQTLLLLQFKQSFRIDQSYTDYPNDDYCGSSYPKTQAWNKSTNCCSWEGVTCDKITGYVVELDLSCCQLSGSIGSNNSLFHLSHLQRLSLAVNDIESSQISKIFGNLRHLTHLNLSQTGFAGQLPFEISKLTELTSLDLSYTALTVEPDIFKFLVTNFSKLSQVSLTGLSIPSTIPNNLSSSLETVKLGYNYLQGELPQSLFHLPNLKTLILEDNSQLYGVLPSVIWKSHATLEWLDLYQVQLSGKLPNSMRNLGALKHLDLSYCGLHGSLPKGIFIRMTQIETIVLSGNRFIGSLPSFSTELNHLTKLSLIDNSFTGTLMSSGIFSLPSLQWLGLGRNQMYGPISMELSSLVNLQWLDISSNNFSGHVDVDIFSNMIQLQSLDLSHNRLSLVTKNNSVLPESIDTLRLASCNITELEFLRSRSSYYEVDLSMNNIHEVPSWLWSKWRNISNLNISYNSITHVGEIHFQQISLLDIRSNLFQGPFPQVVDGIDLFISNNHFSGVIPSSILCRLSYLRILDISNNNFTGSIPQCIGNMSQYLSVLDMRMNKFQGTIPTIFSSLNLITVNLHGNNLEGNIPSSLAKCINLAVLDLGNNKLNSSFPSWLGNLPKLRVLSLRANNFHGDISFPTKNSFPSLQILDLSHNRFIGTLSPKLFKSFKGMMEIEKTREPASYIGDPSYYMDSTTVVNKGNEVELVRILKTWDTVDLSSNNFEGKIPISVGSLISVRQLNFSNNRFSGEIPISFESQSVLESLDLSSNQLIGTIPKQLAPLHFLSKLNLSHNHLTGRIPSSPQFQTFGNDSYIDNNGLCGFPLSKNCEGDEVYSPDPSHSHPPEEEDDAGFIDGLSWRSVVTGYGVGVVLGLWIGCLIMVAGKPAWLIRIVEAEGYKIVMKRERKKRISRRGTGRKN